MIIPYTISHLRARGYATPPEAFSTVPILSAKGTFIKPIYFHFISRPAITNVEDYEALECNAINAGYIHKPASSFLLAKMCGINLHLMIVMKFMRAPMHSV